MDLVLKGRGIRITDELRRVAEHKLAKLGRLDPRMRRIEVEIVAETNPRIEAKHRVEVTCEEPRRTIRAEAAAHDVEAAFDQVVVHLERQLETIRGKFRHRLTRGADKARIPRTSPDGAGSTQ